MSVNMPQNLYSYQCPADYIKNTNLPSIFEHFVYFLDRINKFLDLPIVSSISIVL